MTRTQKNCFVDDYHYGVRLRGQWGGRPAVTLTIAPDADLTVRSLKAQMDNFGWTQRLRDPHTALVLTTEPLDGGGRPQDVCYQQYDEGLCALLKTVSPVNVVVETPGMADPSAELDSLVDEYDLRLTMSRVHTYVDDHNETLDWYTQQSRRNNNVTVHIPVDRIRDENPIQSFSQQYRLPDDRIHLHPQGEDLKETHDAFTKAEEIAKRNRWSVSLEPFYTTNPNTDDE